MTLRCLALVALAGACLASPAAHGDDAARKEALAELAAVSAASGGVLGLSALNAKTGERLQFNAAGRFPMASTFKVPLAIKVLHEVDRGAIRLDQPVRIDAGNLSPGSGELKGTEPGAEKTASVGELLGLMMRDSDNTATDVLLATAGGPPAVTRHVRGLGVTGLEVNRPAAQIVADAWGFKLPPPGKRTSKALSRAQRTVPPSKRAEAVARFLEDARDTTTPDAMVALLERLHLGKALGAQSTELLIDHMENCRTGKRRLKGELPRGTVVAHKTGTLLRVTTNDVGIITLPWSNGPVIIAIYLKGSALPLPAQERSVAAAALVAYRHFDR